MVTHGAVMVWGGFRQQWTHSSFLQRHSSTWGLRVMWLTNCWKPDVNSWVQPTSVSFPSSASLWRGENQKESLQSAGELMQLFIWAPVPKFTHHFIFILTEINTKTATTWFSAFIPECVCVSVKHQPPQADTQTCAAGWRTLISLHANDSLTNCTGCSGLLIVARQKSEEGTGALGAQLLSAVWCYCHLVAVLGKVKKHTERLTGDILGATTITCCSTLMQRRAPGTSTAGAGFGLAAGNRLEHFSNFSHSFVGQTVTIMITITRFSLHHRHIIYPIPVPVLVLKPQNGCEWTDDTNQTWDMLNSCCLRLHKNTGGVSLLVETRVVSNSCITLFSIYHSHRIFRNLDHWF